MIGTASEQTLTSGMDIIVLKSLHLSLRVLMATCEKKQQARKLCIDPKGEPG